MQLPLQPIDTSLFLQLPGKLDELDSKGDLPLNLALQSKQQGVADTFVKHKVNVNRMDNEGYSLLHRAIKRGELQFLFLVNSHPLGFWCIGSFPFTDDDYSAMFLIENGADVNAVSEAEKQTPLHMISALPPGSPSSDSFEAMMKVGHSLLAHGAKINMQDKDGK